MSRITNHNNHKEVFELNDVVISKPFHGSRLYEVIRFLPEFGGTLQSRESSSLYHTGSVSKDPNSSYCSKAKEGGNSPSFKGKFVTRVHQDKKSSSGTSPKNLSLNQIHSCLGSKFRISPVGGKQTQHQEIREEKHENLSGEKPPLRGKKILVVEDN